MASRWTSFVADEAGAHVLHEASNPQHRLRVEHDRRTLLVHLRDEDGDGWTVLAVDRATRRHVVVQGRRQAAVAEQAHRALYDDPPYDDPLYDDPQARPAD